MENTQPSPSLIRKPRTEQKGHLSLHCMHRCRRFGIPSLSISGLVVFVIILPACCTAIYHYVSYKKGWDDEDPECDSACSECNVQMGQESEEEIQFRFVLYTRYSQYDGALGKKVLVCSGSSESVFASGRGSAGGTTTGCSARPRSPRRHRASPALLASRWPHRPEVDRFPPEWF